MQIKAREPGKAEIKIPRADIRAVRVPVARQQQRHRVLRHGVRGVGGHAEHAGLSPARAQIDLIKPRAPQRNDPDAHRIQRLRSCGIHRVVDKRADRIEPPRQRDRIRVELRLKILDLQS